MQALVLGTYRLPQDERTRVEISLPAFSLAVPFTEPVPPRNTTGQPVIYVPKSQPASYIDYILHIPETKTVIFLMVSKMTFRRHDYIGNRQFRLRTCAADG